MTVLAQATFQGPDVDWFALSPLLILLGAALALLLAGALTPTWPRGVYATIMASAAIAAAVLAMFNWDDITDSATGASTLIDGALALDVFGEFATIAICAALVGVALITSDYLRVSATTVRRCTRCTSWRPSVAS